MIRFKKFLHFKYIFIFVLNIEIYNSLNIINYPSSKQKQFDKGKTEYFQINVNQKIKADFLRIYVHTREQNINQEVIMSTTIKEPNRANATLFAEEPYGDVFLYVPKELIDSVFYLNCTCYSNNCPILVKISETNDLNISRDGQHSFLSNPPSINYKYYIERTDYRNETYFDQNATMTLFVICPPETTEVKMNYLYPNENGNNNSIPINIIKTDNGYITSFSENLFEYNRKGLYEIIVKPNETNYITVGSRSTVEGFYSNANHIYPNKRGIFGYFDNSMLSGECYRVVLPYLNNIEINKDE